MLVLAGLNTVKRYLIAHIHVFTYTYEAGWCPRNPRRKYPIINVLELSLIALEMSNVIE